MKGLIWNCRGIRKKGVFSFLRGLIQEHKFHFIGLQETMIADCDDTTLRKLDLSNDYLWKWIPSRGRSGGILSGVNVDLMEVGSFVEMSEPDQAESNPSNSVQRGAPSVKILMKL